MSALNALRWRVRGQMVALSRSPRGYRCRRVSRSAACARWWRVGLVQGQKFASSRGLVPLSALRRVLRPSRVTAVCLSARGFSGRAALRGSMGLFRDASAVEPAALAAADACSKISQLASCNTLVIGAPALTTRRALGTVALTARLHAHSITYLVGLAPASAARTCARISKAHQCWRCA